MLWRICNCKKLIIGIENEDLASLTPLNLNSILFINSLRSDDLSIVKKTHYKKIFLTTCLPHPEFMPRPQRASDPEVILKDFFNDLEFLMIGDGPLLSKHWNSSAGSITSPLKGFITQQKLS